MNSQKRRQKIKASLKALALSARTTLVDRILQAAISEGKLT